MRPRCSAVTGSFCCTQGGRGCRKSAEICSGDGRAPCLLVSGPASRTLPWSCVLRIWDMFLCEGSPVKFRVALALLKLSFGKRKQREQAKE